MFLLERKMMTPITKIVSDKKEKISLDEAQKIVGGYVQLLSLPNGKLLVDEEGLLKNLPINAEASMLANQRIVGNAIFFAKGCGRNWG